MKLKKEEGMDNPTPNAVDKAISEMDKMMDQLQGMSRKIDSMSDRIGRKFDFLLWDLIIGFLILVFLISF